MIRRIRGAHRPTLEFGSLLLAAVALGCAREPEPGPAARSALLVTLDTTRWDSVSFNGCPAPSTPALDALAAEGVVYDRCRSTAPLTTPSHASMLTGLYPIRHGVRDNGANPLPDEAVTLAELARGGGRETAAFVASAVLDRRFGLAQGFDVWSQVDNDAARKATFAERPASAVVADALAWLRGRDRERPFFLWVHVFDPHAPYAAEPRFVQQVRGHPYVAEVAAADHALGELLDELRAQELLDETLVVVVADHGEDLNDHGVPSHGAYLYDSTMRVPAFVRWPPTGGLGNARAGERSDETTSVVDVFPTVLGALGLDVPDGIDGVDLARFVEEDRGVYFETYYGFLHFGWSPLVGWADARGKYLHSPRPELYDTAADPMERSDLLGDGDGDGDAHEERVAVARAGIADVAARPRLAPSSEPVDPALLEEIRALGYAAGGNVEHALPEPLEPSDRPAPRERIVWRRKYLDGVAAAESGDLERAVELLDEVVKDNPDQLYALDTLGLALARLERWSEAIATLRARIERGPAQAATHVNLGFALEATGERGKAAVHYRRALELEPDHPTARANLQRVAPGTPRTPGTPATPGGDAGR